MAGSSRKFLNSIDPRPVAWMCIERIRHNDQPVRIDVPSWESILRVSNIAKPLRKAAEAQLSRHLGCRVRFKGEGSFRWFCTHGVEPYAFVYSRADFLRQVFLRGGDPHQEDPNDWCSTTVVNMCLAIPNRGWFLETLAAFIHRAFFIIDGTSRAEFRNQRDTPLALQGDWLRWRESISRNANFQGTPQIDGVSWIDYYRRWIDRSGISDQTIRQRATKGRRHLAEARTASIHDASLVGLGQDWEREAAAADPDFRARSATGAYMSHDVLIDWVVKFGRPVHHFSTYSPASETPMFGLHKHLRLHPH